MAYKKWVPFVVVLFGLFTLANTQLQFQKKQMLLVLESNTLLSPQAISAKPSMNVSWQSLQAPEDGFSVYGVLDRKAQYTALGFYTTDYSKVELPMKEGRFFTAPDSREAIVGEAVPTYRYNGEVCFDYAGTRYIVIGTLGLSKDSPLKRFALVNDSSQLKREGIPLVFDGKHVGKIRWLKGTLMDNKGVERWLGMGTFLKLLKITTWAVLALGSVTASYFYVTAMRETRQVRFQMGEGIRCLMRRDFQQLTLWTVITAVLSRAVVYQGAQWPTAEALVTYAGIYAVLLITWLALSTMERGAYAQES